MLPEDVPFLGLISEAEPGFTTAVMVAASLAGYQPEEITFWPEKKVVHIHGQGPTLRPAKTNANIVEIIESAAKEHLIQRGEPSSYLQLHTAILAVLGRENLFLQEGSSAESYSQAQQEIQSVLDYRHGFLRFGGSEKSLEVGKWWLVDDHEGETPLADRTEMAVVQYLIRHSGCTLNELERGIWAQFPGLLYPEAKLLSECLQSYGENAQGGWHLREQDDPTKRRAELDMMVYAISGLGETLGFSVQSSEEEIKQDNRSQSIWCDPSGKQVYAFYFSASALLGKYIVNEQPIAALSILVIPGGRANLAMFKLRRDPRLRKIFERDWQFLKFRQARQLAQNPTLTVETLEDQLGLDPLTYTETQMRMF
jgi:hypothetical protein